MIKVFHFLYTYENISQEAEQRNLAIVGRGDPATVRKVYENPTLGARYVHVANTASNDFDRAFERTNHIDTDWTKNCGVESLQPRQRSTSVGDVMVLAGPDGDVTVVVSQCGFTNIHSA